MSNRKWGRPAPPRAAGDVTIREMSDGDVDAMLAAMSPEERLLWKREGEELTHMGMTCDKCGRRDIIPIDGAAAWKAAHKCIG